MLNVEELTEIAKKHNPKYNAMQEYADAYEFFINDGVVRYGGGDCSIVIEKNSGKLLRWGEYFMDGKRTIVEIGEVRPLEKINE